MSTGRPGGLTALAVMNFIFGGLGLFNVLGLVAVFMGHEMDPEATRGGAHRGTRIGPEMGLPILIAFSIAFLASILEVISGFGYLRQKRIVGRVLGNAFALLSIAGSVLFATTGRGIPGMGMNLGTILNIVYPLMTLLLINTTFREDLVN